jgi:hypothetical protein
MHGEVSKHANLTKNLFFLNYPNLNNKESKHAFFESLFPTLILSQKVYAKICKLNKFFSDKI